MTRWQLLVKLIKVIFAVFVAKDYMTAFKVIFPDESTALAIEKTDLPPFKYDPVHRKMVRR